MDINAGYVGLDTFYPMLIGVLMAVNTFGGPLLIHLLTYETGPGDPSDPSRFFSCLELFLFLTINYFKFSIAFF